MLSNKSLIKKLNKFAYISITFDIYRIIQLLRIAISNQNIFFEFGLMNLILKQIFHQLITIIDNINKMISISNF